MSCLHISGWDGFFGTRAILVFEEISCVITPTFVKETVKRSTTIIQIGLKPCIDYAVHYAAESSSKTFLYEASREISKQATAKMITEVAKTSLKRAGYEFASEVAKATASGGICDGVKAACNKFFKETARQQTKSQFMKGFLQNEKVVKGCKAVAKNLPFLIEGGLFVKECYPLAIQLYRGEIGGKQFTRNVSESILTRLSGIAGGFVGGSLGTMVGSAIAVPWCIPIAGFVCSVLGGVCAGKAAKKFFSFF